MAAVPLIEFVGRALAGLGLVALGSFVYRLTRVRSMVRSAAKMHGIVSAHVSVYGSALRQEGFWAVL
jgi:hypothetical protein